MSALSGRCGPHSARCGFCRHSPEGPPAHPSRCPRRSATSRSRPVGGRGDDTLDPASRRGTVATSVLRSLLCSGWTTRLPPTARRCTSCCRVGGLGAGVFQSRSSRVGTGHLVESTSVESSTWPTIPLRAASIGHKKVYAAGTGRWPTHPEPPTWSRGAQVTDLNPSRGPRRRHLVSVRSIPHNDVHPSSTRPFLPSTFRTSPVVFSTRLATGRSIRAPSLRRCLDSPATSSAPEPFSRR